MFTREQLAADSTWFEIITLGANERGNDDMSEPVSIKNYKCGLCDLVMTAIEVNVEQ